LEVADRPLEEALVIRRLVEGEFHHEGVGLALSELLSLVDSAITVCMPCEGIVASYPPEGIDAETHISKEALV
jgi:hypothetical protein